ncbi:uncharacterized protein LOC18106874 isoform X4 [Populus trichocarpa]|uniref:uncharacterized protein LOC18106874 isoform X4 n=1 Tax=Populus trichocarpa TaxID=3694 RepID=UPI002277F600|nr:uncharacterized protein LOC18106874 isoform X4 [Populus trichocarpa]
MVCHMLQNWAGRCDTRKQNCDTLHFLRCCKLRVSRKSFLELKLLKKGKPGVKIYRKLYAEEKEVSNGVLAICVSKLAAQPYLSLASILFAVPWRSMLKGAAIDFSPLTAWGVLGGSVHFTQRNGSISLLEGAFRLASLNYILSHNVFTLKSISNLYRV